MTCTTCTVRNVHTHAFAVQAGNVAGPCRCVLILATTLQVLTLSDMKGLDLFDRCILGARRCWFTCHPARTPSHRAFVVDGQQMSQFWQASLHIGAGAAFGELARRGTHLSRGLWICASCVYRFSLRAGAGAAGILLARRAEPALCHPKTSPCRKS